MKKTINWDKEKTIIRCKDCDSLVSSAYPGKFTSCKCPENDYVYIDQTEFYCRVGGRREKIEFVRK